jgi:hypothetical protein
MSQTPALLFQPAALVCQLAPLVASRRTAPVAGPNRAGDTADNGANSRPASAADDPTDDSPTERTAQQARLRGRNRCREIDGQGQYRWDKCALGDGRDPRGL